MPVCRVILLEERPAAVAHRVTKARLVGTAAKAAPPRVEPTSPSAKLGLAETDGTPG
jgi:hypothetical protein